MLSGKRMDPRRPRRRKVGSEAKCNHLSYTITGRDMVWNGPRPNRTGHMPGPSFDPLGKNAFAGETEERLSQTSSTFSWWGYASVDTSGFETPLSRSKAYPSYSSTHNGTVHGFLQESVDFVLREFFKITPSNSRTTDVPHWKTYSTPI